MICEHESLIKGMMNTLPPRTPGRLMQWNDDADDWEEVTPQPSTESEISCLTEHQEKLYGKTLWHCTDCDAMVSLNEKQWERILESDCTGRVRRDDSENET